MAAYTSKDVARLAGVSQSTVSYVLTGNRPISEETRRRVLDAIEELTYQPNAGARALASQRTRVIALDLPFEAVVDTAALVPFIETISSIARSRDYDVLLLAGNEGSAGLQRVAGRSLCDAILVMNVQTRDERVPVAAALPVPVVMLGVPEDPQGLHCVDLDFAAAGRMAVEELAATGHQRIAIIEHPAEMLDRRLSFIDRFLDAALEAAHQRSLPVEVSTPAERGRVALASVIDRLIGLPGPGPLGLIVPNMQAQQSILRLLAARGVVAGRDISLIGLCTDADATESDPQITNLAFEPLDLSQRAMQTLLALLEPTGIPAPPVMDLIPPRLTRRQTVVNVPIG
ncbi:LacI family transcriptional regulator [Streptacidiphilus sp. PB12-B1b]|uniref:LacI family DNA-binding transcriptional regulator n=1 Tax=Streptacidiphilus TaxID=228398 RepID=UPI00054B7E49|nr:MULTISPECIES: LacI family DNA-binding transcriptional regulator [Streptacidiphilus]QMU78422.1 LacI family transcriptional regulator [Streptacidiphilus sp. PB12-B1b]